MSAAKKLYRLHSSEGKLLFYNYQMRIFNL